MIEVSGKAVALIRCQQLEQVLAPSPRTQQSNERDFGISQGHQRLPVQFEIVMHHQCRVARVAMKGLGRAGLKMRIRTLPG